MAAVWSIANCCRDGGAVTSIILACFIATYLGMALGRVPGLALDRAGMALLGAIALLLAGAVAPEDIARLIDLPTLAILFGLMVLSAQFAASGFYDWCSGRIAATPIGPVGLLVLVVVAAGGLSALLSNDVVVFAMTPLLCRGLVARGLDPRPFLIALAGAANAGSAATIIGNPQNILIGQIGGLEFWSFLGLCAPPALAAMAIVLVVVWWVWRGRFQTGQPFQAAPLPTSPNRPALIKALVASLALLALFASPLPKGTAVLGIAGAILISRRQSTRQVLAQVDWPLLLLFAGLFVVTGVFAESGLAAQGLAWLGLSADRLVALPWLSGLMLLGSNSIGNVPAVMLLLSVWPDLPATTLTGMALLSTLAGNFLLVGSLANLIVVERARVEGYHLGFVDHARCGVPMTLASMAVAVAWLGMMGGQP